MIAIDYLKPDQAKPPEPTAMVMKITAAVIECE